MEIVFNVLNNVNEREKLNILSSSINGVGGIDLSTFVNIIKKSVRSKIAIIDSNNIVFHSKSVKSEINFYCKKKGIFDKAFLSKIDENLSLLKLDIIDRKISELSSSEIFRFYLFLNTLFSSDIYILNNIFNYSDRNNEKLIFDFIKKTELEKKIIFIFDNDINRLYYFTNRFLLFNGNMFVKIGNTDEVLTDIQLLNKNKMDIPQLPLITNLAMNKKNVKLFFHKDVRDIMKDIYKHI